MMAALMAVIVVGLVATAGYFAATRPCESGHHRRHLKRRRYELW
jgi:hypothetical protein